MIVRIPFGREAVAADLRGQRCRPLETTAPRGIPPARIVERALDAEPAAAMLSEMGAGGRPVVVLVPDGTRKAWLSEVLPVVIGRLVASGAPPGSLTVLVACGTHPASRPDHLVEHLGVLPDGVEVVQNDSHDAGSRRHAGSTSRGVEVRLHSRLLDAGYVVSISVVQHHYFAGFGGGPKMVFPGTAGHDEIQANHSRVVDLGPTPPRRHPCCEPGVLDGNPVAEEIAEAASLRPVDLAVELVAGADGRPAWCGAGPAASTHREAIERVRDWYEAEAGPFGRMVVSGGGYPTDDTLIQAHKALDAAARFCDDGAEILFVARCGGGVGSPAAAPFLDEPEPASILARLSQRYVQYGQTILRLVEKTTRFRVSMMTALPADLVRRLGMTPVDDVSEVLDRWRERPEGEAVGLMVKAPVYPAGRTVP